MNNSLENMLVLVVVVVDVWWTDVNQNAITTARIKPIIRTPKINPLQHDVDKQHWNDFQVDLDLYNSNTIDWYYVVY